MIADAERRRLAARRDERSRGLARPTGAGRASGCGHRRRAQSLLLVALLVVGLGPLLWLAKSAITPTQDMITHADGAVPARHRLGQPARGVDRRAHRPLLLEHVVLALGSWLSQIVVATTGGFALVGAAAEVRECSSPACVLATLFVPAVVLLVPLYIEIVHPPLIHHSLINSYWAVWLPAGASAFNVVLVKRFFDNLPREIFEAARVDGAGPFRLFCSIVLPMSQARSSASSRCSR